MPRSASPPVYLGFALLASVAISPTASGQVVIEHEGVDCVVAQRFPRIEARLAPTERVARARILFRAEGGANWYAVSMLADGAAYRGVLPKPLKSLKALEYYVEATDVAFASARTGETRSVVEWGPGACEGRRVAAALPSAARVVVEGPTGVAGAPLVPAGFSLEGVAGATPTSASAGRGKGLSGAKLGLIGGGAAAVLGGLALAAGGGASDAATGVGGGSGGGSGASLAGRWVGSVSAGTGLTLVWQDPGRWACTYRYDSTVDLSQSGTMLSGNAVVSNGRIESCTGQLPPLGIAARERQGFRANSVSGTATPEGSITLRPGLAYETAGELTLNGTATATTLEVGAAVMVDGFVDTWTWRMTRQ